MESTQKPEGQLIAVCVGKPRALTFRGQEVLSGIHKIPVEGLVRVSRLNLAGDEQADLSVHGGEDKAVYLYASEHYPAWERELNRTLPFGTFGENLTVSGLLESTVRIDDVLEVGGALLQVTQPRLPCFKLGMKMGDPAFLKRFLASGRTGYYARVLREGLIEAGQAIRVLERASVRPSVAALVARVGRKQSA